MWGGEIAVSPDGALIAAAPSIVAKSGPEISQVLLVDGRTLEIKARLVGHTATIMALTFRDDGKTLCSFSRNAEFLTWDVAKELAKAAK